jgi:glutamate-ammonia-ligase adenylyltransferase
LPNKGVGVKISFLTGFFVHEMSETQQLYRVESVKTQLIERLEAEQYAAISSVTGFEKVINASEYVVQQCLRKFDQLKVLLDKQFLERSYQPGELRALFCDQLEQVDDEVMLATALRLFRLQQMVRIIWRDIAGLAALNETLEDLSELADVCVDEAVKRLFEWLVAKSGMPRDVDGNTQELVVISMGKLGARELNLSSDIDLIFLYPERGETDGRRPIDNEKFFTRLSRQVIKAIGENTADGFVFRVDTRLRPFGDAGPLAIPLGFLEDYLQGQAREWERYAMVKARVISGSESSEQAFSELVRPFVYRRYLDFGAIESIREMKKLIANEMHNRGMDANIKLGMGGIREIEFIGQAFQLIRGGRDPNLQIRPIQQVLALLAEKDILPEHEVKALLAAYEFLRLTENRLQAWKDEQTHLLPEDEEHKLILAQSMGYVDWESFSEALQQHRLKVQGYFDLLFAAPQADEAGEGAFAEIWQEGLTQEAAIRRLDLAGFDQSEKIWKQLHDFRQSSAFRYLGDNGRRRLDQLMPLLLEAIAATEHSDRLLERVIPFLESITRRTAYLAMMVENPLVLSQLLRLMGESVWIAGQITRHPLLLDELIDPRRLYAPLKKQALLEELDITLAPVRDDEEQYMERLRQFVQASMLRVAAADVTNVIPVEIVSDYLTEIAEVISDTVYRSTFHYMSGRYGKPQSTMGQESGFAVIGYGKLGGFELGYSSDLDLVFVHDSQSSTAMTDGDKQVANDVFYARLGQRMIHHYTTRMPSGTLYEIDMRLRPNGNSGLLVTSLKAFEKYQKEEAWTWEHQALVRARAIAGDPQTMAGFEQIRRNVLMVNRDASELQKDVREMREKMRDSLDKSDEAFLDIKQGHGGIADIEFMVQYAVLRWANEYPDLLDWSDNARILETLAKHRLFDGGLAEQLLVAYRAFRTEYHRRSLQQQKGVVIREKFEQESELVQSAWQTLMIEPI